MYVTAIQIINLTAACQFVSTLNYKLVCIVREMKLPEISPKEIAELESESSCLYYDLSKFQRKTRQRKMTETAMTHSPKRSFDTKTLPVINVCG